MTTQILYPDGAGNYSTFTSIVGGTIPTIWTDDNDASYAQSNANGQKEGVTLDNLPSQAVGGNITSLKAILRGASAGAASVQAGAAARVGGADGATTAWLTWPNAGISNQTTAEIAHPSASWTYPEINAMEVTVVSNGITANALRIHEVDCTVVYIPATGSWESLIVGILGAVLGSQLALSDMPGLIDAYNRAARGKSIIHSHEAVEMYEDLKADKHKRYF